MPGGSQPLVTVVTVNHNGGHLLGPLLESLERQSYPSREILVVDNHSTDGSVELVRRDFPRVRVLALTENTGFVGGNNAGIRAAGGELVALINNDAVADPGWLQALVETALEDPQIAAVGSKILFFRPFLPIRLTVSSEEPGPDDPGALVGEESAFEGCAYRKPIFKEGFRASEEIGGRRARRMTAQATVFLPIASRASREEAWLRLLVAQGEPGDGRRLRVGVGTTRVAELRLGSDLREHRIGIPSQVVEEESFDLLNNAGTALTRAGDTADRGIYEPDRGQFDTEEDLEAICGAAVLFRRPVLDRVGLFDRDFFMYYEDTDLSWRIRAHGYRLRYQPRSVVRHLHAHSSVEWSPLFVFLTARNKILMIAKNGGWRAFLRAYGHEVARVVMLVRRWAAGARCADRARVRRELATRLRVQRSLLKQIPRAFLKRLGVLAH